MQVTIVERGALGAIRKVLVYPVISHMYPSSLGAVVIVWGLSYSTISHQLMNATYILVGRASPAIPCWDGRRYSMHSKPFKLFVVDLVVKDNELGVGVIVVEEIQAEGVAVVHPFGR